MTLLAPVNLLMGNLDTTLEIVILFITGMCCLIVAAKDIRIGALLLFFFTGLEWLWFYLSPDITERYAMYVFFGSIIILALSLSVSVKTSSQGGWL